MCSYAAWRHYPWAWRSVLPRFFRPRSARRVSQPHREYLSETVFEPEARSSAPGELVERPVGRGGGGGARGGARVRRSIRGSPVAFHAAERVRRDSAHPGHEGEVARSGG